VAFLRGLCVCVCVYVCLSVGLLVTFVSPTKHENRFWCRLAWAQRTMYQMGSRSPHERAIFGAFRPTEKHCELLINDLSSEFFDHLFILRSCYYFYCLVFVFCIIFLLISVYFYCCFGQYLHGKGDHDWRMPLYCLANKFYRS